MHLSPRCMLSLQVILIAACGSTSTYVETGTPRPSPRPTSSASDVDVFTATRPTRPFREAGMIETRQSSAFSTDNADDVVRDLRREAAAQGCDGVILTGSADEVVGGVNAATGASNVTTLKGYRATCIVYTRPRPTDPRQEAMRRARVTRRWSSKGHQELSITVGGEAARLSLTGAPIEVSTVHLALRIKRRLTSATARPKPKHESCEIELVSTDGTATARDRRFSVSTLYEDIEGRLDTAELQQALETEGTRIRLCDDEIPFEDATRQRLMIFVRALQVEAEDQTKSAEEDLSL